MTLAVAQGTFADFKLVKTRSAAQLVIEIPIEMADATLLALGGCPKPGMEINVAIARIELGASQASAAPQKAAEKRAWSELTPVEQAGIMCANPSFQKYAKAKNETEAADYLRFEISVKSRRELAFNTDAQKRFKDLQTRFYDWQQHGEAA
jgi:hypothetical protein